ncbi:MAG: 1-acyl-sn-glycerol-3-phosphate acyltransferase [Actinomycetia bacterium]|nr:1-acyl-sn-glycerol-3-phosphate acyltransferase [Actinomycetes bacterium]
MSIPAPPFWVRRLLQILWLPLVAVLTALCVPLFLIALLLWPIDRKLRVARLLAFLLVFLWLDAGLLTGVFYIWLTHLGKGKDKHLLESWRAAHEKLLIDALDGAMEHAQRWLGLRVDFEEPVDFGSERAPLLVLSRHAGPGDSIVLAWLLAAYAGRLPRIVLKDIIAWDPGVGAVLDRIRSYFVPSRSGAGDDRAKPVRDLTTSLDRMDALLLFPEGMNWTPKRWKRNITRLREQGETEQAEQAAGWANVLPPRSRGVATAMGARPDADVMIVAHTGLEWLVTPWQIFKAIPLDEHPFLLRTWTFEPHERPSDPEEVGAWLDEQWDMVDEWVGSHREFRPKASRTQLPHP